MSNQSSAFVILDLDDTVGVQPNGVEVRNFAAQSGRLVIVGKEPLLEATFSTNQRPLLLLFSQPGSTNAVLATPALDVAAGWTEWRTVVMAAVYETLDLPDPGATTYYHAEKHRAERR